MNTQERALLRQMITEVAAATITREQAAEIAVTAAALNRPSYYAEPFVPHEWVVDAVLYGYRHAVEDRVEQLTEYVDHFEARSKARGKR